MDINKVNQWLKAQLPKPKPVLIIIVIGKKKDELENDLWERGE